MRIERVGLRDLRPITETEFQKAIAACEKIKAIREGRHQYILDHKLDEGLLMPAGKYGPGGQFTSLANYAYDLVISGSYEIINHLRLYTHHFCGYSFAPFSNDLIIHPIPKDFDEQCDKLLKEPDQWVNAYIQLARNTAAHLLPVAPKTLGEIGWDVNGRIVNHDIFGWQEKLAYLDFSGILLGLRKRIGMGFGINILELGGGYGGLAYFFKAALPEANYFIVDLPESLLFSAVYLAITGGEFDHTIYDGTNLEQVLENNAGFKFISNFMFDDLVEPLKIDLMINTSGLPSMSLEQVEHYAAGIEKMLTGVLYEHNGVPPYSYKKILAAHFPARIGLSPSFAFPNMWGKSYADIATFLGTSLASLQGLAEDKKWTLYPLPQPTN